MCGGGGGGDQTVTQKTELDPALRRLLYGGTMAAPRGGFGGAAAPAPEPAPAPAPGAPFREKEGGDAGFGGGGYDGGLAGGGLGYGLDGGGTYGADSAAVGGLYAMGGMVRPQQGIASLNQGQMPMMNGGLPNLSDPMVAATLAAAALRPQMQYGAPMGFAMGGYVEGPGTGTSDSIDAVITQNGMPVQEAMLSDGEFVMTERAVRGAGDGDRERGAARMYEMMRQFERGGRV
jgi:hypothetical protein